MNQVWSFRRTRELLRKVRHPAQLERDTLGIALRAALGTPTAREALLSAIDGALAGPDDMILRRIVTGVDFEGRTTKVVAGELHLSERHCFRRRAEALDAISSQIESLVRERARPSLEALVWYSRGRRLWRRRTPDCVRSAIACFEEALQRAPTMAKAHCGIADARLIEAEYLFAEPRAAFSAALDSVHRALELEPHLAEAQAALADIRLFGYRDFRGAARAIDAALTYDPACIDARIFAVSHALARGDTTAALDHVGEALLHAPEAVDALTSFGVARCFEGRFDDAIEILGGVVETDPDYPAARYELARALTCAERYAGVLAALEGFGGDDRWPQVRALQIRARARDGGRAPQEFPVELDGLPSYQRAVALVGLGRSDEAIEALQQAIVDDDPWIVFVRTDPLLASLRGRFGYRAVAEQVRSAVA
ncbi:MAG: transcriptional regulator, CadC [Candidatus Eremiobacteraeota bacterium]|nr:transcriptional regulator, CadC [Candidatus Eremiobacteraeota bacterium]